MKKHINIIFFTTLATLGYSQSDGAGKYCIDYRIKDLGLTNLVKFDTLANKNSKSIVKITCMTSKQAWKDTLLLNYKITNGINLNKNLFESFQFCFEIEDSSKLVLLIDFPDSRLEIKYINTNFVDTIYQKHLGKTKIPVAVESLNIPNYKLLKAKEKASVVFNKIDRNLKQYFENQPTGKFREIILGEGLKYQGHETSNNEFTITTEGFYNPTTKHWQKIKIQVLLIETDNILEVHCTSICRYATGILMPGEFKPNPDDEAQVRDFDEEIKKLIYSSLTK